MDWSAYSDGQLAGAFAEGGANEPFDELVRRHSAMVFRTCRRVTGSYQDAEDAMQLAFAALAERAGSLTSYRSLGGWLYSTAWHIARHAHRSHASRRRRETEAPRRDLRDTNSADANGADEESLRELYRALEMLPSDYRDVIVLHHLEGLTIEQVAELMGCSIGTVASRLSRGRAMMRQRLREHDLVWSAAMVSWILSAQWTTDDQAVATVVLPEASKRSVAAKLAAAPSTVGSLSGTAATVTEAAAVTTAGWTLGKCAVAACASFLAVGVASVTISHFSEKPPPRKHIFAASASATAAATQDSAGKSDDAPVATRISGQSAPAVVTVPEPAFLPPLLFGLYLLRRRR